MNEAMKQKIENGEVFLGIELGSTRIKAVLIDNTYAPIASGGYNWENRLEDGYWTYHLDDVWTGVQTSFRELAKECQRKVRCGADQGGVHGRFRYDARLSGV